MFFQMREHWALQKVSSEYNKCLQKYGPSPQGVHWRNTDSQQRRFDLLLEIILPQHRHGGVSLYDLGCGYGAFFRYIRNHAVMRQSTYIGYEINKLLLRTAKRSISDGRAKFVLSKKPTKFADYGLISGTFNLKMSTDHIFWWRYVQATLTKCWQKTKHGMAFNLLDIKKSKSPHDKLFYCNPQQVLEFCQNRLTQKALLKSHPNLPDAHFFLWR